jgi:hypothetical protein
VTHVSSTFNVFQHNAPARSTGRRRQSSTNLGNWWNFRRQRLLPHLQLQAGPQWEKAEKGRSYCCLRELGVAELSMVRTQQLDAGRWRLGAGTDPITSWQKPRRRTSTCQQKPWITSPTTYTTQKMYLETAASSLNHGSRAPENTFSQISSSQPKRACGHGRRRFQILQPLLRVTPNPYTLVVPMPSRLQVRRRVAGSEVFPTSSTWSWPGGDCVRGMPLSSHSTDSHPPSNPSAWLFPPFRPRAFSTLSFHFLFSRTWL